MAADEITQAQEKGRRLGFLIAAAGLKEDEQQALLDMLPHMTAQQLDRLLLILETHYLQKATESDDQSLIRKLQTIDTLQAAEASVAAKRAQQQLSDLEKTIEGENG